MRGMILRRRLAPIPPERSVLFVCMGNICRSPTAEGVFRAVAERADAARHLMIASAGTGGWHVGEAPDRRASVAAQRRGYDLTRMRARQVSADDFARFGWILAMDRTNLRELEAMQPEPFRGHLGLFMDFAPQLATPEVPDPYYGGPEGFEYVLDIIEDASRAFLDHLQRSVPWPAGE
jgi:protein-tyrosine phosphatase